MSSCQVLSQDQPKVDEYAIGYPLPHTTSYMSSINGTGTVIILGSIRLEEWKNGKIKKWKGGKILIFLLVCLVGEVKVRE